MKKQNSTTGTRDSGAAVGPTALDSNTRARGPKFSPKKAQNPSKRKALKQIACPVCDSNLYIKSNDILECRQCGHEQDRTAPDFKDDLQIDFLRMTFHEDRILNYLDKFRPLDESDLKRAEREEENENPYSSIGLKKTPAKIAFWKENYLWFCGAFVSIGSLGGKAKVGKDKYVQISIPGQALENLRKNYGKKDIEILKFFFDFMNKKVKKTKIVEGEKIEYFENVKTGNFTRVDWAIDQMPETWEKSIIEMAEQHLKNGWFTAVFDREKTAPQMQKSLIYKKKEGLEKAIERTETIYLGSRRSETFARIYDKRIELIKKGYKDPGRDWYRHEIELKGERAHKSILTALEVYRQNGGDSVSWLANQNYRRVITGLFLRHIKFRDAKEAKKKARIKNAAVATWYTKFLSNTRELILGKPKLEKKPRAEHKENAIEQCSKRISKILISENADHGLKGIANFFNEMLDYSISKMDYQDHQQIFNHMAETIPIEYGPDQKSAALDSRILHLRHNIRILAEKPTHEVLTA